MNAEIVTASVIAIDEMGFSIEATGFGAHQPGLL